MAQIHIVPSIMTQFAHTICSFCFEIGSAWYITCSTLRSWQLVHKRLPFYHMKITRLSSNAYQICQFSSDLTFGFISVMFAIRSTFCEQPFCRIGQQYCVIPPSVRMHFSNWSSSIKKRPQETYLYSVAAVGYICATLPLCCWPGVIEINFCPILSHGYFN